MSTERHPGSMLTMRILLVLLLMFSAPSAFAQVFIEQGKVEHLVSPGEKISAEVTIDNTTGKSVKVSIYWEDFMYQSPFDGAKKFAAAGTLPTSMAKWIQFSPRELILPAFGKASIAYVIQVPPNASGGYYGVLFVEPHNKELNTTDKGVRIITRVGSLFFVETGDRQKSARLDQVEFHSSELNAKLYNEGNVVLIPQASYYVMDREGIALDRGQLKKNYIPMNAAVDLSIAMSDDLPLGDHTLVLTIDLQDGDVLVKEIEFTKSSNKQYRLKTIRD